MLENAELRIEFLSLISLEIMLFNNLEKLIQKVLNTVTSVLELLGENKIVVNLVLGCMTARVERLLGVVWLSD